MENSQENQFIWTGKLLGRRLGHQGFFFVVRIFGRRFSGVILWLVAWFYFLLIPQSRCGTRQYLSIRFPGKGRFTCFIKGFGRVWEFSNVLLDRVFLRVKGKSAFKMDFPHTRRVLDALALGKGLIILSAHMGAWEIAGHFFSRLGKKVWVVMYDIERPDMNRIYGKAADSTRFAFISSHDQVASMIQIYNALKNGEIVVMQGDRVISSALETEFLGKKAHFPAVPYRVALKTGSPLIAAFCIRKGLLKYEISAEEHILLNEKSIEPVNEGLRYYINALEKQVGKYPLQWYNFFDFWSEC